jgi:serine/threonine protein kinase
MAKPQTLAEFVALVEKSQLIDPAKLPTPAADPSTAGTDTAVAFADRLVIDGLLTRFQADHLLRGKWSGFHLGPYKVLDKIGTGTNSQVYLCEHTKMRRRVAVKVLQADKAQDAEVVKRFEREARAAAAIRHPHIVHAFDLSREGRMHYLVMEYVDGESLLKRLTATGRASPSDAANWLWQAATGLQVAHDAGIVHRDLKPSNLMVTRDGQVKILDLGLARYAGDDENLTRGGAVLGLAAYIAPEQACDSHNVDARADVYGLGATFWLALTGKKPPVYGDFTPPGPRSADEKGDYDRLLGVIRKMMALKPDDRYQSAGEVAAAASPMLAVPISAPRPVSRPDLDLNLPDRARPEPPRPVPPLTQQSCPDIDLSLPERGQSSHGEITLSAANPFAWIENQPLPAVSSTVDQETLRTAVDVTPAPNPAQGWAALRELKEARAAARQAMPTAFDRTLPAPAPFAKPNPRWLSWLFLGVAAVLFLAAVAYTFWG